MKIIALGLAPWVAAAVIACSAPPIEGTTVAGGAQPATPGTSGSSSGSFERDPGIDFDSDGGVGGNGGVGVDIDGDGVPDTFDCDPSRSALGGVVLQDDLSAARGVIEAAPGFDPSAWRHAGGEYQQTLLRNASDASLFKVELPPSYVVSVTGISMQTGKFAPDLHQQLILVGADVQGGRLSSFACGVEFVEGLSSGVVSVLHLSGSPTSVVTTPIKREARPSLGTNQEFGMEARVMDGALACSVIQGQTVTTVAAQIGPIQGTVGFYTHQAAVAFKNTRICQVAAPQATQNQGQN